MTVASATVSILFKVILQKFMASEVDYECNTTLDVIIFLFAIESSKHISKNKDIYLKIIIFGSTKITHFCGTALLIWHTISLEKILNLPSFRKDPAGRGTSMVVLKHELLYKFLTEKIRYIY